MHSVSINVQLPVENSLEQKMPNFVQWFRSSTPYIQAHRNKTFVINFGGEVLQDENFQNLIHN
jgi:amino-acid N-acetyltransferase